MTDAARLARLTAALADRYRIARELGAGGMATVYLGHDIKHDRDVAIKVLHPDLGAALGADRFLTEIRTTARLQHPHILPLLDSGEAEGLLYYVMPYVTGETLRARLEREKQLPIPDAINIAREVADAVSAAHAVGVIHRDIKPENILLQGGHALVADFGIALAVESASGSRMTQTGLSLGTPQYMSPEQAMGEKQIDARSDVYALGAVTYEMLVGDPPFTGSSVQAIVAKVLTEKPTPIRTVRDTVAESVEATVMTALAKLPADRFASASEFAAALVGNTGARPAAHGTSARTGAKSSAERRRGLVVAGITLATCCVAAGWLLGRGAKATPQQTMRFEITPPSKIQFGEMGSSGGRYLAISTDGRMMVYTATGPQGSGLYLQRVGSLDARLIPGGEFGSTPSFSPDDRWIAFQDGEGRIRKVSVEENALPTTITSVASGVRGITWISKNEIAYSSNSLTQSHGIWRVSADGGAQTEFAHETGAHARYIKMAPFASQDGRYVFYLNSRSNVITDLELGVFSFSDGLSHSFDGKTAVSILGLIDGTLFYVKRDGSIVAAAFNQSKMTLGTEVQVGDSVQTWLARAPAALSPSGTLLYLRGGNAKQLVKVDERGTATPMFDATRDIVHPRLSPDGKRIAFEATEVSGADLWVTDLAASTMERLTRDGHSDRPEWTADGRRILFPGRLGAASDLLWQPADGSGPATKLLDSVGIVREGVMSPDGSIIAYRIDTDTNGRDLYVRPTAPGSKSIAIDIGPTDALMPRFSPDSKWLAYVSDESGATEVYVRPALGGGRVAISSGGGSEPIWTRDGKRMIYRSGEYVISATVALTPGPAVTRRDTLLRSPGINDNFHPNYDVFPDGRSFVFVRLDDSRRRQMVVINWLAEIKKLLGAAK